MKSNVDAVLKQLDEAVDDRLEASGALLADAYRSEISRAGLVDTGDWLGSVTYSKDGNEVRAGTPIDGYPFFLEVGFRHWRSGEIVGPFYPLTKAASVSEGPLQELWKQPIKG